ncbi:selenocysteine-specific translation elongation factor [Candidatus Thiodictyon syntrophicum]|jgi:selenocysteine-specific elongation factor|uniref:Selenocysteine-specific elongation factor n=1 Tax=Candidatus Thiodictyon syntrophicum TaxID=1166950 RepID=A0A2K8UFM2_9GAMM|nr:selenocysteine-specific translation elongation factor [Candidatus Thiodictyon syntrophicum]AUB84279.1 selenocysteine-specific translation elongation factor [Candidatus Thiodictyon syntrophicum]
MIIGTAGHIDHGKSALVRALTGVETDRLPEEQARGITLDLGFAYQEIDTGEVLGFVDVPGHERLVHNMVAGAAGIDYVILVVAADDGPMPQTREHLEILDLLGLERGLVALTKIDRVPPARVSQAAAEVRALLQGTALAGAPVFPVNTLSGDGIEPLALHLRAAAADLPTRRGGGGFRLAVDRSFSIAGAGTVVTGIVLDGRVRPGDRLLVSPAGHPVRVRGVHAQGRPTQEGRAGQRCALNLADLHRDAVGRGDLVLAPALHLPTRRLDVRLRVLAAEPGPLKHWTPVHCHLGAAHLTGRVAVLDGEAIAPGAVGLAQLILDADLAALRGDRLILRDQSARRTIAGGWVLDPEPPARGRRRPARLALLAALSERETLSAAAAALDLAEQGLSLERLERHWNLDPGQAAAIAALPGGERLDTPAGPLLFARAHWQALQQRVLAALAQGHAEHPDQLGPDRERLRRGACPAMERAAFAGLLERMVAAGALMRSGPWVHLPGHAVRLAPADATLWQTGIRPLLEAQPFQPPRVRDLARALAQDEALIRQLLQRLAAMGEVYRVAHDHYFTPTAVADLGAIALRLTETDGAARAAAFRDAAGTGRKLAIQILEFFDRIGYSRRIGDDHRVFRDSLLTR